MTSSTRPYHHGRLRDALLEAGFRLARAGGPDAVVLRAVSREAGVSHNAAYRHFADHDELLAAVGDRCMQEMANLMRTRIAEVRTRGAVKRAQAQLTAIGTAYVEFARTEPGWFRTAFVGASMDKDHGAAADEAGAALPGPFALLNERLDRLVEVGALPPERRPGAEHAAWAVVHGLSTLLIDGPLRALPDDEVHAVTAKVLAVVQAGL